MDPSDEPSPPLGEGGPRTRLAEAIAADRHGGHGRQRGCRSGFNRTIPDPNEPHSPDPQEINAQNALRFFKTVSVHEFDAVDWNQIDESAQRMHCAAVVKELYDLKYRPLENRLNEWDLVALEAGFKPGDIPTYSTFSRHIKPLDNAFITEATRWAENAALHASLPGGSRLENLGPRPSPPLSYYEHTGREREVSMSQKMSVATALVEKYMDIVLPYIGFERDSSAPNFRYPTSSFYRLLAHMALEDCYAENGREILHWKWNDVEVPPPSTLRANARKYEVTDHRERLTRATCELLDREGLLPDSPVALAYDITDVHWYGNPDAEWVSSDRKRNNTTQFWKYAVLSIATPGQNYVLGVQLIKNEKVVASTLKAMLRSVLANLTVDVEHIYMDRGLAQEDIIKTCREYDLDFLIQTERRGEEIKELLKWARDDEVERMPDYEFKNLDENEAVNVFASPIRPEQVGSKQRKYRHTSWFTDYDISLNDGRNLRGLAYQFRYRWRVETAIRQLKNDFEGRCASSDREVRALYLNASQLFFNFWVALRRELGHHLGDPDDLRITGLETLHAIRDADFENTHGDSKLL